MSSTRNDNILDLEKGKFGKNNNEVYVRTSGDSTITDGSNKAVVTSRGAQLVTEDDTGFNTTIDEIETTITTTAVRIVTPDTTGSFSIYHQTEGAVLYLGDSSVTTSSGTRLEHGEVAEFSQMKANDANEIYGIVSSGTLTTYVSGVIS